MTSWGFMVFRGRRLFLPMSWDAFRPLFTSTVPYYWTFMGLGLLRSEVFSSRSAVAICETVLLVASRASPIILAPPGVFAPPLSVSTCD